MTTLAAAGNREPIHSAAQRKHLGAFYTPEDLAAALVRWAIRRTTDRILEPSYGGCAFLWAAYRRLEDLLAKSPARQLYGCDVDSKASRFLKEIPGLSERKRNFRTDDFLAVSPGGDFGSFDVVVGNPPYVRHHWLPEAQRHSLEMVRERSGALLPRTASLWAYFVLHAMSFLRPNGRLAMVLPGALITADYSEHVRNRLERSFRSVSLSIVKQRLFAGVDERIVVIRADGFGAKHEGASLAVVNTVDDLSAVRRPIRTVAVRLGEPRIQWKSILIGDQARAVFERLQGRPDIHQLGAFAKVSIGAVTGANKYFVLSRREAAELELPRTALRPIVSSTRALPYLLLDSSRRRAAAERSGRASLLFWPEGDLRHSAVRRYLRGDAARAARSAFKCRNREPWYAVPQCEAPDAFLTYVNEGPPRIVLNATVTTCTNALHRLWWRSPSVLASAQLIAISFYTSVLALSAEIVGRDCGGGALKLEPTEAAKLILAVPALPPEEIAEEFRAMLRDLDAGSREVAVERADRLVLERGLGMSRAEVKALREAQRRCGEFRSVT